MLELQSYTICIRRDGYTDQQDDKILVGSATYQCGTELETVANHIGKVCEAKLPNNAVDRLRDTLNTGITWASKKAHDCAGVLGGNLPAGDMMFRADNVWFYLEITAHFRKKDPA